MGLAVFAVSGFGQGPDPADQYYDSIRNNDLGMLKAMVISRGVKHKDKHGTTPLHYAAANGSVEALRAILSREAEVERRERFRRHAADVGHHRAGEGPPAGGRRRRCQRQVQNGTHRALPGGRQRRLFGHR